MIYETEPLEMNLTTPEGTYNVTVSIKAHCDTVLSLYEDSYGFVTEDCEFYENQSRDFSFTVKATNSVNIKIYCDGRLTATAMAEYEG